MSDNWPLTLTITSEENLALARFVRTFFGQAMDKMSSQDASHLIALIRKLHKASEQETLGVQATGPVTAEGVFLIQAKKLLRRCHTIIAQTDPTNPWLKEIDRWMKEAPVTLEDEVSHE